MRALVLIGVLVLAAPAAAQRHKLTTINAETPEGQLLQQIGTESEEVKKLALLEQFAAQYPNHEGILWVYAQMQPAYLKAQQYDKAMAAGEKLLALDPEDVEMAHGCLKAAEAKKEPDAIKKWAVLTSESARKVAQSKKPEDEDEEEEWKRRVDFAKQLDVYTEYSLYAAALQVTDPRKKIELVETLEQRNPESQYLPQARGQYFLALRQTGDVAKAVEVAEKVLETDQTNEDMLLVAADYYLNQKKDQDKALQYASKLVEVMESRPKPEGMSAEDWEKSKNQKLGYGHWLMGIIYGAQGKHPQADKHLREALPALKDIERNEQLLAAAYFYLGVANFRLGDAGGENSRIIDALKFSQACAAIKGPYQAQAQKNISAIQSRYRIR